MIVAVERSEWATTERVPLVRRGRAGGACRRLATGTIFVEEPPARRAAVALEAALAAQERCLVVVEDAEVADDLVRDSDETDFGTGSWRSRSPSGQRRSWGCGPPGG